MSQNQQNSQNTDNILKQPKYKEVATICEYDQQSNYVTNQNHKSSFTYHHFIQSFESTSFSSNVNNRNISVLNNYTNGYDKHGLNDLIMVSLANKTPLAQFIVDVYFHCALKYNWTINEFMENSKFLSMFPSHSKTFKLIRKHLSEYVKYFYKPITNFTICPSFTDDVTHNQYDPSKHNHETILYYTSTIHKHMYILNKVCQIDIIFVPEKLDWINDEYFDNLGITYKSDQTKSIYYTFRYFNSELLRKFHRCVILVMYNNNIKDNIVYIFCPLENNLLPPQICNYTEIPWICNTKSNVLPDVNLNQHNPLGLSIHIHRNNDKQSEQTARVYLSYGSYGCRVFKYNLRDVLSVIGVENEIQAVNTYDWCEEMDNSEFKDYQFNLFVNTYFVDLKLIKPNIAFCIVDEHSPDEYLWIASLCESFIKDRELSAEFVKEYMYVPKPIEYYEYINIKFSEYYQSMNCTYNDQFIKFIYDNGLDDCPLSDQLGINTDINDCVLLDFDVWFPFPENTLNIIDRNKFIF
eukprot:337472_1